MNDRSRDKKNGNYGPNIKTYILIVLMLMVLFAGLNRFVFPRGINASSSNDDPQIQIALEYYHQQNEGQGRSDDVKAIVRSFGCHEEIHIYKNNQLVMKVVFFNGNIYEIS